MERILIYLRVKMLTLLIYLFGIYLKMIEAGARAAQVWGRMLHERELEAKQCVTKFQT